jgi:hypothetical protein
VISAPGSGTATWSTASPCDLDFEIARFHPHLHDAAWIAVGVVRAQAPAPRGHVADLEAVLRFRDREGLVVKDIHPRQHPMVNVALDAQRPGAGRPLLDHECVRRLRENRPQRVDLLAQQFEDLRASASLSDPILLP